jgi:nucleoside-triphosphatase THEP1
MTLVLLSAPSGLGKTMACTRTYDLAQRAGFKTAGILSLPSYTEGEKTAILLQNMETGEIRPFARRAAANESPDIGYWKMDEDTIQWGNALLDSLPACDILFVDEIGPLELIYHRGLVHALDAVKRATYRLAIITIRPSLLAILRQRFSPLQGQEMILTEHNRDELPQTLFHILQNEVSL